MRSHLFTDTQDFDGEYACPPEMICICLRLDRAFYLDLCRRAAAEGLTTGQYMQHTIKAWQALVQSTGPESKTSGPYTGPEQ